MALSRNPLADSGAIISTLGIEWRKAAMTASCSSAFEYFVAD